MGVLEGPWKSVRILEKSVEVRESPEEVRGKDTGAPHCLSRDFLQPNPVSQPACSHPLSVRRSLGNPAAVASLAALVSMPLFSYFCKLTDRVVCEPVGWSFQVFKFVLNFVINLVLRICHQTILHSLSKTCALLSPTNVFFFLYYSFFQHVFPAKKLIAPPPGWMAILHLN